MTTSTRTAAEPVFAPDNDVPICYIQRTREYYLALGYDNPYRWAHFADAPFTLRSGPQLVAILPHSYAINLTIPAWKPR